MTDAEFRSWLATEVEAERMTVGQHYDLLEQKELFDRDFGAQDSPLRQEFRHRIVGYVAGRRRSAEEIHRLIDIARTDFPDRMIYFEPIGFDLY